MADLVLSVDVTSLADARRKLDGFQKAMNGLSVNQLASGVATLQGKIKQLVEAQAKGTIGTSAYNKGLLELKRAYEQLGYSSQQATAAVRQYAAQLQRQRAAQEAARAAQEAARAAEELARAQAQAAARTRELRLRFEQGYAASENYNRQVRDLREALRQGIINTNQYREALSRLNAEQRAANAAAQGLARGINTTGVITQQAGYQIGDFIVQVQSGTNAFVAFGQQATQIAGTLTLLGGKWIAIGSALGIAIPLFTAVAAGIMRTRKEAKQAGTDLESAFGSLEGAYSDVEEAQNKYNLAVELMGSIQSDTTRTVLGALSQELSARQKLLRVQRSEFALQRERLQAEIEARNEVIQEITAPARDQTNMFPGSFVDPGAADRAKLLLSIIDANKEIFLQQAKANAQLELTDSLLLQIEQDLAGVVEGFEESARAQAETERQAERTAQFLAEQEETIANQTILYLEIAKYGENSLKVEEERAYQARLAYENELRREEVASDLILVMMDQYDAMVRAREEAESNTKKVEELADQLGISLDYAQELAAIGFGNIWEGADGAAQLASNLALAARMAANYEGRENAFGGVRVGEPPIMTSEGIEVRPQTMVPRFNPFAGMELEDLLPPREKSKGEEGPNAVERLQQEIAFRQRTLNLSKEERNLQTEIFRITNALGKDRNKYSSDFIANLAQQNLALQEQERVIEEARQRHQQMADVIENGIGDALMSMVDGTKSVKDAFKDMARQVIAELYRIIVVQQIANSLANAIMGGFGGGGAPTSSPRPVMAPGRASGGSMMAGNPYLVGERGPELVIPGRSATVMNADLTRKSVGGDSVNIVNNINVTGGTDPAAIRMEVAKLMPQITNATKTAVIDARRRGGQMKAAFQ